jgi:hypothetical protein
VHDKVSFFWRKGQDKEDDGRIMATMKMAMMDVIVVTAKMLQPMLM